jgi:hypothetical protein
MARVAVAAIALTLLTLVPSEPPAALDSIPDARTGASEGGPRPERAVPRDPGARVQHHLREIAPLVEHFEAVLSGECPRFGSRAEWRAWIDDELDRVVLLVAHVEQAWVEAKRTSDDDVRRLAKTPRRNLDRARSLVAKLEACADQNGDRFAPTAAWRRVERDVPQRRSDIALPP